MTLFTACSDDDDATSAEGNIVGTWILVDANNIPGYTLNECTGQSTITFNADNTASSEFFSGTAEDCDSESETGNWSNSSGSQYTIQVPQLGEVPGRVVFNGDRFTFTPDVNTASSLTFERQ
tara:strand:+ start:138 stop:503 length:366 start_codon:yes stop_codon:yes gene_type:complete